MDALVAGPDFRSLSGVLFSTMGFFLAGVASMGVARTVVLGSLDDARSRFAQEQEEGLFARVDDRVGLLSHFTLLDHYGDDLGMVGPFVSGGFVSCILGALLGCGSSTAWRRWWRGARFLMARIISQSFGSPSRGCRMGGSRMVARLPFQRLWMESTRHCPTP